MMDLEQGTRTNFQKEPLFSGSSGYLPHGRTVVTLANAAAAPEPEGHVGGSVCLPQDFPVPVCVRVTSGS